MRVLLDCFRNDCCDCAIGRMFEIFSVLAFDVLECRTFVTVLVLINVTIVINGGDILVPRYLHYLVCCDITGIVIKLLD